MTVSDSGTGDGSPGPRWHAALAFAVTGRRWDDLDEPATPEPGRVADEIIDRYEDGVDGLLAMINARRSASERWPYELPDDLRAGIGAAQWLAALAAVREHLGLDRPAGGPVLADRPPNADERRLLGEVPPHHGG